MSNRKGLIVQLTGLSGSGKTTISNAVKEQMEDQGYKVALLDGDVYRQTLCRDLGFSKEDRIAHIQRLGRFASVLAPDYDLVLIAAINPYEEGRAQVKAICESPLVFLDCSLEDAIARDPKDLYRRALLQEGHPDRVVEFTGITAPFERPSATDLTVNTSLQSVEESCAELVRFVLSIWSVNSSTMQFKDFLKQFRHNVLAQDPQKVNDPTFLRASRVFMAAFHLGVFDTYRFIYNECRDEKHFEAWLIEQLGKEDYEQAIANFLNTLQGTSEENYKSKCLTAEQIRFWQEEGYLHLPGLVPESDCDAVRDLICARLNVRLDRPDSWYPQDPLLQGILIPSLKHEVIAKIRNLSQIRHVFADLYRSDAIIPTQAPLGYHPPESSSYAFRASGLHWDIDFDTGVRYHVQGLVYLQDVAADGGAFSLIPGYHKLLDDLLKTHGSAQGAMEALRDKGLEKHVAGKKGDLIVWIETMPHAATPNRSDRPRFVQYIGFEH